MRKARLLITFAAISALLWGCAGAQNSNPIVPSASPRYATVRSPAAVLASLEPTRVRIPRDLYIADSYAHAVDILRDKTYRDLGAISFGKGDPYDVFLDARGNLYVANIGGGNVAEFAPGNTGSPNYVYSAALAQPQAVTTDAHDNLFVGDDAGNITEYFQDNNVAIAQCYAGAKFVSGVAVDSYGDVFAVTTEGSGAAASLVEYSLGLKGCNESYLGVQLPNGSWGIALDKNGNILVAAPTEVAVIPPPFDQIAGTIGSGFSEALTVRLNRANTEAFVSDFLNGTVTVVSYPGGSNITVLGIANGLYSPASAVAWPNAVY